MRTNRTVVVVSIVAGLALLILPFAYALTFHEFGADRASQGDLSVYLGTLGGIMGAVFVVGGLLVAVTSVVTLLTIESTIDKKIQDRLPDFAEQAEQQLNAYSSMFAALAPRRDWRESLGLFEEALKTYKALPNARSTVPRTHRAMGRYFADYVDDYVGVVWGITGGMASPWMEQGDIPDDEAVEYLKKGSSDDADQEIDALLAILYGFQGRYHQMKHFAEDALHADENGKALSILCTPLHLAMLFNACGGDAGWKAILAQMLGVPLRLDMAEVKERIEEKARPLAPNSSVNFPIVYFAKPGAWAGTMQEGALGVTMMFIDQLPMAGGQVASLYVKWPKISALPPDLAPNSNTGRSGSLQDAIDVLEKYCDVLQIG